MRMVTEAQTCLGPNCIFAGAVKDYSFVGVREQASEKGTLFGWNGVDER